MTSLLITGVSGFVGGHMAYRLCGKKDLTIHGVSRSAPAWDFVPADLREAIIFHQIDLLDDAKIETLIKQVKPDYILHLASFSSVAASWKSPVDSFLNNATAFLNIVEAVRLLDMDCRILSVGSSEEYGIVDPDNLPLKEESALMPANPYAVARVSQEQLALIYAKGYGLDICCTRSFNHIGPGQRPQFVASSIVKSLVEIKIKNEPAIIKIGDGRIVRDFCDIQDVLTAYEDLLEKGKSGEVYNVCSGVGRSILDLVRMAAEVCGIEVEIVEEKSLMRPIDNPALIGDCRKLSELTGWQPEVDLKTGLKRMFDYWVEKIRSIS